MKDNKEPLTFGLDLKERLVTIGGEAYVLVELDGAERDGYLNNVGARMRVDKEGKPSGVKNFDGLQASLVAASLRKIEGDKRNAVSMKTIQAWPAGVVSGLFDAAKELSDLGDEGGDDEGNA